jgi:glycosyltransferase involved in cell wall biosynthesis
VIEPTSPLAQGLPADELLTVIVPCLNEEASVAGTVEAIQKLALKLPLPVQILLVDDGSTDGTPAVMAEICRRVPSCRMIANPRNLGIGRSVLNAYADVEPGSWVSVIPGDNEVDVQSLRGFVEMRESYDVILGYIQNPVIRSFTRRLVSKIFLAVVNLLYGFDFRYLNGLKLYRVEALAGIPVVSSGHAFNGELLAKAILRQPLLRIGQAPFVMRGRTHGSTKAVQPLALLRGVRDVLVGYRSVAEYRARVIEERRSG